MIHPMICSLVRLAVMGMLTVSLSAQDALRAWSSFSMDTDAYRLPAIQINTQSNQTAVLRADGRIYVHGGETGFMGICRPPLPPAGLVFTSVSVSYSDGLGVLSDGNLVHWHNSHDILDPPPQLPPGVGYVRASIGDRHALALRSDGTLVGWYKPIGTGGAMLAAVPTFPPGAAVVKFRAGVWCSMVLLSNGTIQGWGYSYWNVLNIPPLPPNTTYIDLWAGPFHFFAKRSDGTIVSWGDNSAGQLALPPLPAGVTYVDFGIGTSHTVALRSDGQLAAWGDNTWGQCDVTLVPPGLSVVQLDASNFTTLARLSDGSVIGWGGTYGELPLPVPAANERFVDATVGYGPAIGMTSNGECFSYGPSYPWLQVPPALPPGLTYTKLHLGWRHAGALRSDGQLIMWGDNPDGRCTVPPLPSGVSYVQASLADRFTAALRSDGEVVMFGAGAWTAPALPAGVRYVQVDVEEDRAILLRSDGRIELGGYGAPSPLLGVPFVKAVTGGWDKAVLRADGQVQAWHDGGTALSVPPLPPGVVYVDIDCGAFHLVMRRSDGEIVVCLGQNVGEDRVPPLQAGESYVQIDATQDMTIARVGPTRTYVSYAGGCAGSLPAARLVPRETPHIGTTHEVRILDLPQDCAVMVFGWNQTQPTSLATHGMSGCFQHVSVDAAVFVAGQHGNALYRLPIPAWPGLVGLHFYNQAIVFDPASNSLGAVVSDAARGVIGRP